MVSDAFSTNVMSLAKIIASEKNDYSFFKENIVKLDNYVDAVQFFNALQATSYVVNDYENEKGASALNFTKTNNKIEDQVVTQTHGYSVSIPNEKIMYMSTSSEAENSLISNMLKELYLTADRDLIKSTLEKITEPRPINIPKNEFPVKLLEIINTMCSFNDKYIENDAKNIYSSKKEDVTVIMNSKCYNLLLGSNLIETSHAIKLFEGLNIKYNDMLTDNQVVIYDKNYLNIFSQDETLETIKNPKYNFTNYFLRIKYTIAINPFFKRAVLEIEE